MKNILAVAIFALGLICSTASAASLKSTPQPSGGNNYALYIAGEGTVFDAIQVDITPAAGLTFINLSSGTGGPTGFRQPNDPFTFRNRILDADPLDGGKGWLVPPAVVNANLLSYGVTSPGAKIDTTGEPGGRLFLANVMTSASAQYPADAALVVVTLVNAGQTVQTLTGSLPSPEPASFGLATIAGIAGLALRRRRA